METPKYKFSNANTIIFISGIPLSGKSTISPLIAASIEGCGIQSMDIFRLFSQEFENMKPIEDRDPFVTYGSCDSYKAIGNGSYSSENMIRGFNKYAKAVCRLLSIVLPKLEAQGARDIIFEGVQLTPREVEVYLQGNNKLVILTTSPERLQTNKNKLYGEDLWLHERYSDDKLMLLQNEIVGQSKGLPKDKVLVVDNSGDYVKTTREIVDFLIKTKVIEERYQNPE